MSKSLVFGACLATLSIITQAHAANGVVPASTLDAMGLGGATIVSDAAAAEVRGMGYLPISIAAGGSFAHVGSDHHDASAGTVNVYLGAGQYAASGANYSEAGIEKSSKKTVNIGGAKKTISTSKSLKVYAGGYSSAMSL